MVGRGSSSRNTQVWGDIKDYQLLSLSLCSTSSCHANKSSVPCGELQYWLGHPIPAEELTQSLFLQRPARGQAESSCSVHSLPIQEKKKKRKRIITQNKSSFHGWALSHATPKPAHGELQPAFMCNSPATYPPALVWVHSCWTLQICPGL